MSSMPGSATESSLLPPKKRRTLRWTMIVLVLVVAGWWFVSQRGDDGAQQNLPLITTVEVGNIENTISAAGSLKPSLYVDVGAQVSGQLQKLHVEVGDKVEAEQLLAEIDARTQVSRVEASRSALEALEAQVDSRQASLDLARANAQRQERLTLANATSQQDYDTAMANLANAQANVSQLSKQIAQSRSSLSSEETELEYTRIYAPIEGTIVSIEMNEGRTLNANQSAPTILRVADLSTMTVETQISEADIGNLEVGMDIYFTTLSGGNRRWFGRLRQILPTPVIENNVVLYTGLFDVDNSDGTLLPEMTAQVFFITASARDVLTVPVAALTYTDVPSFPIGAGAGATAPGAPNLRPPVAADAAVRPDRSSASQSFPGAGRTGTPFATVPSRRPAVVRVVADDGTQQQREIVVGVTSRVAAEVISGLQAGERVVAGIIQADAGDAANAQRFGPPGFGGFR